MQITFNTNVFTGPLLSGNSFNDTLDSATFTTTGGGTFVWATHLTTESVSANGSGGWTGTTLETGTDTVASSGESTISAAYTATTGTGGESRKFSYYIRDAAGNDSNVVTESFTVNSSFAANAVDNQTTAYIALNSGYAGPAAGKTGTISFWFNGQGTWNSPTSARLFRLAKTGANSLEIYWTTSGRLQFQGRNASNSVILDLSTATSTFVVGTWYHCLISWDLANNLKSWYVNDALNSFTTTTFTNDDIAAIDYARVWSNATATIDGYMAELWMDTTYRDFSVEATRRNFITAAGKPADLTGYGSPHMWLQGNAASVGTNSGSGGNLSVITGTFADAPSSPSD